jgi:hypothetical protein
MWWRKREKTKGDITVEVPDNEGRKRRIDVPKKKLEEWIKTGQAKPVFRVLIRGPWDGVKEDFWDIAEENRKFVGEDNMAYAICHYEKGEPQYSFVTKQFWDHYDEISAIMANSEYAQEQKVFEVRKILD